MVCPYRLTHDVRRAPVEGCYTDRANGDRAHHSPALVAGPGSSAVGARVLQPSGAGRPHMAEECCGSSADLGLMAQVR